MMSCRPAHIDCYIGYGGGYQVWQINEEGLDIDNSSPKNKNVVILLFIVYQLLILMSFSIIYFYIRKKQ